MNSERYKFPKIAHVPWSGTVTKDDRVLASMTSFDKASVVVSEKMDGECSSLYRDYLHARSINSQHHASRSWLKNLHAGIACQIPDDWRICGENLYATHTIHYKDLPSFFLVFAVYDAQNICLSWPDTKAFAASIGLACVPVLYEGLYTEAAVRACFTGTSVFGASKQEGYVLRLHDRILWQFHALSFAKYVRPNHVQTDEHWLQRPVIPNELRKTP